LKGFMAYNKRSFLVSCAVHLLVFVWWSSSTGYSPDLKQDKAISEGGEQAVARKEPEREVIPNIEVNVIEKEPVTEEKAADKPARKKVAQPTDECPNYYGGIGVRTGRGGVVTDVYQGYPAFEVGIHVGDIILTGMDEVKGTPGTQVTVKVLQDGETYEVDFIRAKICYEDNSEPEN